MPLEKKAYYNLLRLNFLEDSSGKATAWQVEDFREKSSEELFSDLKSYKIVLDKEHFVYYAQQCESPEELAQFFTKDVCDKKTEDHIYLLVFELWRRFLPEKQTLSIFCDELDYHIHLYDKGILDNDELIQDGLIVVEQILEENVEMGTSSKEAFSSLLRYFAHDLEKFLYDYILDQIEATNHLYATELIDAFYPYVSDQKWFDLLRVHLVSCEDIVKANELIALIIKDLNNHPDLYYQFALLHFMVETGDRHLFVKLVKMTLALIENEHDFKKLLEIVADYFHRLDKEDTARAILQLMTKRAKVNSHKKIDLQDQDMRVLDALLKK